MTAINYIFSVAAVSPATACSLLNCTFVSGAASMSPSASKVKTEGQKPMRQNDTAICSGTFINDSTGAIVPCSCNLKISSAGQLKVKGV